MTEPHAIDEGGQRDLINEANNLKRTFTKVAHTPSRINFTSLLASKAHTNGHSLHTKNLFIDYVPDTYYASNLIAIIFAGLMKDTLCRKANNVSLTGFTMYIQYQFAYHILNVLHASLPYDNDIIVAMNYLKNTDIQNFKYPSIYETWFSNVGILKDVNLGKTFRILLDVPDSSSISDYYLSPNTGHLLPNFRVLQLIALLPSSSSLYGVDPKHKNLVAFKNKRLYCGTGYESCANARCNYYRIPGLYNIHETVPTQSLIDILRTDLPPIVQENRYLRYLQISPSLISFLDQTYTYILETTPHYPLKDVTIHGGSQLLLSHNEIESDILIPEIVENTTDTNPVASLLTMSLTEMRGHSQSKTKIENGDVLANEFLPIIRIAHPNTQISDGADKSSPVDPWYLEEHPFKGVTQPITAMHSGFTST